MLVRILDNSISLILSLILSLTPSLSLSLPPYLFLLPPSPPPSLSLLSISSLYLSSLSPPSLPPPYLPISFSSLHLYLPLYLFSLSLLSISSLSSLSSLPPPYLSISFSSLHLYLPPSLTPSLSLLSPLFLLPLYLPLFFLRIPSLHGNDWLGLHKHHGQPSCSPGREGTMVLITE